MATEPEVFDCEVCEFRQRVDGLDADNVQAWQTYADIFRHRWVWDVQAGGWWLAKVVDALGEDEQDEVLARVDVIYDTLHPKQEKPRGA